jgi:branched-chain amino acid aminotransferase
VAYKYFSHNGRILPIEQAAVPLGNIEYAYGFGVYESIRFNNGKFYFLEEHCERLLHSARVIDLECNFSAGAVRDYVEALVGQNEAATCNVKIMLIGGKTVDDADLYVMCLNPLFPRRELYKDGAGCTTFEYERDFPQAKTLNMLPSYLAYRRAKAAGAYEALLINRQGCITEGTRSNFFVIKDKTLVGPPGAEILPGITRAKVVEAANAQGFEVVEKPLPLADIDQYDGAFLTSTSAKIMPVKQIGEALIGPPPAALKQLMRIFDDYLAAI